MEGVFLMLRERMLSMKETDRASVIGQVSEKRLGQREAAEQLGLSIRAGEAAAGALPQARVFGSGFGASG